MSLKQKIITLFKRHGDSIKFASGLVLEAVLPGSPAVVKLVSGVLDCAIQTSRGQPDFDESKLPRATQEDLKRVGQILDVLGSDLQTLAGQVATLETLPEAAKQLVSVTLATNKRCRTALHKLDHLAQHFDCLEEQNRCVLQGQGYATGTLEEILPLMRRLAGIADYVDELRTAGVDAGDFKQILQRIPARYTGAR